MLDDLPKQLTFSQHMFNGAVFYLQAGVAPCGHWLVGYYNQERNLIPKNYFAHCETLEEAVGQLKTTLELINNWSESFVIE